MNQGNQHGENTAYVVRHSGVAPTLFERLRQPASAHTVPNSLPILCFGNCFTARVASIGINPSDQEYLSKAGQELTGTARRFQTLTSLGASSRAALTDEQCLQAVSTMLTYFRLGKPVYGWFRALDRVTRALGATYAEGKVAHLDLVQEATNPTWSTLGRDEARALLASNLPFLRWQLSALPVEVVLCNGKTPLSQLASLLDRPIGSRDLEKHAQGTLARVTWYILEGTIAGHPLVIAGWNIPLAQPTGLGRVGEEALGSRLRTAIGSHWD